METDAESRVKAMPIGKNRALDRALYGCVTIFWSLIALTALVLLAAFQRRTDYQHRVDFLLPNSLLLLGGLAALLLCGFVYRKHRANIDRCAERNAEKRIRLLSAALFFIQAYLFYNIYFLTDWDVSRIVNTANSLASGGSEVFYPFSRYPNNLTLTWILTALFRCSNMFFSTEESVFFVILCQCAASCLAGYLLFQVVKDMTNTACGFGAWLVYLLHIALSPWLSIPYSDAMTLLIPICVLRLYQTAEAGRYPALKWAAMGFVSAFGYKLKPQCAIILIAIVICEAVGFWGKESRLRRRVKQLGILLAGAAAALALCNFVLIPSLGIATDPDQAFGPSHFLMMGLDWDHCGTYNNYDVWYSASFTTRAERTAANLQSAAGRIKKLGAAGLLKHLARKSLVNFGDGTYAWGKEGEFYYIVFPDKNSFASPLLRSIFYTAGTYYPYFAVFQQFIWITILLSSTGIALYPLTQERQSAVVGATALSLVGIVMFQTIFEARARYFFAYSPLFILAAVLGLVGFIRFFRGYVKNRKPARHPSR